MPMSTITVAGINPGLKILGAAQQFNYDQSLSAFQITNSFIPSISIPSQFNHEYRNNLFSGFRWSHLTTSTDTYGSLTLQSFINALSTGTNLMKFSSTGIDIYNTLNFNSHKGSNVLDPVSAQDIATKNYVDTNLGSYVISVSGTSGKISSTGGQNPVLNLVPTAVTPGSYNNTSLVVDGDGRLTAAKSGLAGVIAALYMSGNNTATSVTVAGDYVKIAGTTTATVTTSFTAPTDNKFVYVGTDPITSEVRVDLSAIPTLPSTLSISIFKNGSQILAPNSNYQLTPNKQLSLIVGVPVTFNTNDYVEIFITSDAIDGVTVTDMNFQVII